MSRAPRLADFSHRVALCRGDDVVVSSDQMVLVREAVTWQWAAIRQPRPSYLGQAGFPVKELFDRLTHYITVRQAVELNVASTAWVYEEFLKSPPRWYKVIGFNDTDRSQQSPRTSHWIHIACHLWERSDFAAQPVDSATTQLQPRPSDVAL